jgi:hypothetical protein
VRRFIGYVPKEVSEHIVSSGLINDIQPRLERIWHSETGFVDVMFQLVGPKESKAHYYDCVQRQQKREQLEREKYDRENP